MIRWKCIALSLDTQSRSTDRTTWRKQHEENGNQTGYGGTEPSAIGRRRRGQRRVRSPARWRCGSCGSCGSRTRRSHLGHLRRCPSVNPRRPAPGSPCRGSVDNGSAAAEFAIVAPIFLLLLFIMVTLASVFFDQLHLQSAARDSARAGAI
ncbi:MAG: pilus assembly protein, partial [Actinobacteria bacterium]|nr:pilus assembly protein [Actinomycetota bacterium]